MTLSLKRRLILRVIIVLPLVAALLFGPAGTLRFWQGWVLLAIFAGFNNLFLGYFYRRDPKLVERRLQSRETQPKQKQFKILWLPMWIGTLAMPGFDHRFGWSAALLGTVPPALEAFSFAIICAGWLVVFYVMRFNSFASAVVQVEAGQKVITDGPYRLVRHPMYTGFVLMILATPVALGSYLSLAPAVLLVPVLMFRMADEERLLRRDLPGYAEYCERTRYRLVPYLY